ncbi:MAG: type II secretion system GspH family protein [bacterium]|nr:type II secretion system GspH family protein [bacterium]
MKRTGFTLAEVLIALGIVGVIAALTMPTFVTKTSTAKIGPQLAKAVSGYEQATKAILNAAETDSLNAALVCPVGNSNCAPGDRISMISDKKVFLNELSRYMNGSDKDGSGTNFKLADGTEYQLPSKFRTGQTADSTFPKEVPLATANLSNAMIIDINGVGTPPDQPGRDQFFFTMWCDGSLKAVGTNGWDKGAPTASAELWSSKCPANTAPTDAKYCAGHIFENGLKVLYK